MYSKPKLIYRLWKLFPACWIYKQKPLLLGEAAKASLSQSRLEGLRCFKNISYIALCKPQAGSRLWDPTLQDLRFGDSRAWIRRWHPDCVWGQVQCQDQNSAISCSSKLLSTVDWLKHHPYNCLWRSPIVLGHLQISLESRILLQMAFKLELIFGRVSSALVFWISVSTPKIWEYLNVSSL